MTEAAATSQIDSYGLRGRIVTMTSESSMIDDGVVYVTGESIIAVTRGGESRPADFSGPVVDTGGTIFPGLIDLHNHLSYNVLPPWVLPRQFSNFEQATQHGDYRRQTTGPMEVIGADDELVAATALYTQAKSLLGGATTSQGIGLAGNPSIGRLFGGLLRIAEQPGHPDLPRAETSVSIPDDAEGFAKRLFNTSCLLVHLADGTDERARAQFERLRMTTGELAISDALAGVYCTALDKEQLATMNAGGASMVWSPYSDLCRYGETADIVTAREIGMRIGIGCDWSPWGSKNLLAELKVARLHSRQLGDVFTPYELVRMATTTGAEVLKWQHLLGTVEPGKLADLLVLTSKGNDPWEDLIRSAERDVLMVTVGGIPRVGHPALMDSLGIQGESLEVGGDSRILDLATGWDAENANMPLERARQLLDDALQRLPELADEIEKAAPAVKRARQSPITLNSMRLDPLTVVDDPEYLPTVALQPNVPGYIKNDLAATYGVPGRDVEPVSPERQPAPKVVRDYWTVDDTLGYRRYARAIAAFIRHEDTRPPLTIGVKGPWGAGKTSVMRMVQEMLDPPEDPKAPDWEFPRIQLTENGSDRLQLCTSDNSERSRPRLVTRLLRRETQEAPQTKSKPADEDLGVTFGEVLEGSRVSGDLTAPEFEESEQTVKPESPRQKREAKPSEKEWRPTVWFNPWMYQTGEEVWAGLAQTILSQVTDRMPSGHRERFWYRLNLARVDRHALRRRLYRLIIDRLLPALITMAVSLLFLLVDLSSDIADVSVLGIGSWALPLVGVVGSLTFGGLQLNALHGSNAAEMLPDLVRGPLAAAGDEIKKDLGSFSEVIRDPDYESEAGYLYLLQNDIHHVLELVATPTQPIVIFVDDLDRCSPGVVGQTIEAINLFLAGEFPNCLFVLAVEPAVVAAHVEAQHKGLVEQLKANDFGGDWSGLGWRFLEKVVQLPLSLPRPSLQQANRYLDSLFGGDGAAPSPRGEDAIREADAQDRLPARQGPDRDRLVSKKLDGFAPKTIEEAVEKREALVDELIAEGENAEVANDVATDVAVTAVADVWTDNDPVVRSIIKHHALSLPDRNPREMKRFINLFRFYSFVSAPTWLAANSDEERKRIFDQVARLSVLAIRWPFFLNFLAQQCGPGVKRQSQTGDSGDSVLEYLEQAARDSTWDAALGNIKADLARNATGSTAFETWKDEFDALRMFLAMEEADVGTLARGLI